MPLYEYDCDECQQTVEILVRNPAEQPACPDCGTTKLEKRFSVPAAPAIGGAAGLPISSGEGCGAPRCCGGGCDL